MFKKHLNNYLMAEKCVLPESGIYDYEPGDRCFIQFELPNYFKLQKNSGCVIICQSILFRS